MTAATPRHIHVLGGLAFSGDGHSPVPVRHADLNAWVCALLAAAALRHTQDMAYNGYREASAQEPDAPHNGSDGSTPQQRITAAGYDWRVSGENVAAGYALADMVTAWLNSPGHCQNIMNPKFREIGISYMSYRGAKYNTFYTQDFGVR